MAREVSIDFDSLCKYLRDYTLAKSVSHEKYLHCLKPWHRKLFSLLVFEAECRLSDSTCFFGVFGKQYLAESCSDFAQACFAWVHGAYKPSSIMLRTAIETFVKASVADHNPGLLKVRSVFELFDAAASEPAFSGQASPFYSRLRGEYASLCAIVHSATPNDFGNIGALRMFPKFAEDEAEPLAQKACCIADRFLGVLLVNGRDMISTFHHRNRESFLDGIPPTIKGPILQNEVE